MSDETSTRKFDILDSVDDAVDVLLDEHRRLERNDILIGDIPEALANKEVTIEEMVKKFELRLRAKLGARLPNPVRLPSGEIESFKVSMDGESFSCLVCGCNVFHKPDDQDLDAYACNSCKSKYQGGDE